MGLLRWFFLIGMQILGMAVAIAGSNSSVTYQGRILKPDGSPIEGIVSFQFILRSPTNCVLWAENQTINMSGSKGAFTAKIGEGVNVSPGTHGFDSVFNNGKTLTGLSGCTIPPDYVPSADDDRTLSVVFDDGSGPQTISGIAIKNVPFAQSANSAMALRGRYVSPTAPTNGQVLAYNAVLDQWVPASSTSGVTSVGLELPSIFNIIGSPVTSMGTLSATLAAQSQNFVFAGPATGGTGTPAFRALVDADIPSLDASKIGSGTLATSVLGVVPGANGGTVVQVDTGAGLVGGPFNVAGTISLGTSGVAAGSYGSASQIATFTVDQYGRLTSTATVAVAIDASQVSSGTLDANLIPDLDAAKLVSGTLATARLGVSGVTAGSYGSGDFVPTFSVDQYGRLTSAGSTAITSSQWSNIALGINYGSGGSVGIGVATPVVKLDVAGAIKIANDSAVCGPSFAGAIRYSGGLLQYCDGSTPGWVSLGVSGSGLQSLNGLIANDQFFAVGSSGTLAAFTSSGSLHTLNIPMASTTDAVGGLLSHADYLTLMNGTIPAARLADTSVTPGSYGSGTHISQFTVDQQGRLTAAGSVSVAIDASQIVSGTLATSVLGVVPGANGGTVVQVDTGAGLEGGPINNHGTISLGTSGVASGSYGSASQIPTFTVDQYGRLTSTATVAVNIDASQVTSGTLDTARLGVSGVTAGSYGSGTHVPTFNVDQYGRLTSAGSTAITSSQWSNIALGINYGSGGSVGIGVATPAVKLDVAGAIKIANDSAVCGPSFAGAIRYNAGFVQYCDGSTPGWVSLGVSGSGLQSLNGLIANNQDFAVGSSGTVAAFTSSGSLHTLNIPMASTTDAVGGLLSHTEYLTLMNGTIPAARVADLDASQITSGTLALARLGTLGVAQGATGLTPSAGDANKVYGVDNSGNTAEFKEVAGGTGITVNHSAGTITISTNGMGSVTEVIAGAGLTGGTITSAGTIALPTLITAGTVGSATYIPQIGFDAFGRIVSAGSTAISLSSLGGTLGVANGGTGLDASSAANGALLIGNGSGFTLGTLTYSNGMVVTNSAGTINLATNAQTANVNNTIITRDGSGNFAAGAADLAGVSLRGSVTGTATLTAPSSFTNYAMILPTDMGTPGQVLSSNGTSQLSWVSAPVNGGTILAASGSAGTPGISFLADQDTGLSNPGANTLAISTGGTTRIAINSMGYVGIGGVDPIYPLHVAGTLGSSASFPQYFPFNALFSDSAPYNQGVGGGIAFGGIYSSDNSQAIFSGLHGGKENGVDGNFSGYLSFHSRTTLSQMQERMRITSEGRVGIGTISPNLSAALEVSSTNRGFLPPRMDTVQRIAISSPQNGLVVFDNTEQSLFVYSGGSWSKLGGAEINFKAHRNGVAQSIPFQTWTKLLFTTADFNVGSAMNLTDSRFQPSAAGYYQVMASTSFPGVPVGQTVYICLRKTGATNVACDVRSVNADYAETAVVRASTPVYLDGVNDYIEAIVYFGSASGSININGQSTYTYMAGFSLANGSLSGGGNDNLGNHIATTNLVLGGNWISGDGDPEGLSINSGGSVGIGTSAPEALLDINGALKVGTQILAGSGTMSLLPPLSGATSIRFPSAAGTSGQVLSTDGTGSLSWVSVPSNGGTLLAASGSAGTPGFAFSADPDTGLWNPGANTLAISTGGTARITVNSAGNVGIGTMNPTEKLEVAGAAYFDDGSGSHSWIGPGSIESIYKLNSMLGSGSGNAYSFGYESATGSVSKLNINFESDNDTLTKLILGSFTVPLELQTQNGKIHMTNDGDVGIGTSDPIAPLHVVGPNGGSTMVIQDTTGWSEILFKNNGGNDRGWVGTDGTHMTLAANAGDIRFLSLGTTERMRMTNGGNLIIGTLALSPGSKLEVSDGAIKAADNNEFRFGELLSQGTNFIGMKAPGTLFTDYILTLPDYAGEAGQILTTDGTGILSWTTPSASLSFPLLSTTRGSVGTAAYSFSGDGDTGLYSPGANQVALTTGGTARLSIGNSGRVSIGGTTGSGLLNLERNENASLDFYMTNTSTGNSAQTSIAMNNDIGIPAWIYYSGSNHTTVNWRNRVIVGSANVTSGGIGLEALHPLQDIRFSVGGGGLASGESMRLSSGAQLLLGTTGATTTTNKLEVYGGAIMASAKGGGAGNGGEIRLGELLANGTNWVSFQSPDALAANYTMTLPNTIGTAGQVLRTDGTNTLSWVTAPTNGGTFLAANGSAGAPGFSFNSDSDTGLFRFGPNTLGVSAGGTMAMTIKSNGNVGFGTSDPQGRLHIDVNNQNFIYFGDRGDQSNPYVGEQAGGDTDVLEMAGRAGVQMRTGGGAGTLVVDVSEAGNVGVGDDADTNSRLFSYKYSTSTSGYWNNVSSYTDTMPASASTAYNYGLSASISKGNNTFMANATNIGVFGGAEQAGTGVLGTAVGVEGMIHKTGTGNITYASGVSSYLESSASGTITNFAGFNVSMVMTAGTVTTAHGLYIDDMKAADGYGIEQVGANDRNIFYGTTGIGNISPSALLHVGNNSRAGGVVASFSTTVGTCSMTPATSGNGITCASDERLKENIETVLSEMTLEKLLRVNSVTYNFKKDPDKKRYAGYLAQQLKNIFPELVRLNEEGYYEVSYDGLIPYITQSLKTLYAKVTANEQAIQKAQREIASVKAESTEKDQKIQKLESEMRELKSYLCAKDPRASICK